MKRSDLRASARLNLGRDDKDTVLDLGLDLGLSDMCLQHPFRINRQDVGDIVVPSGVNTLLLPEQTFKLVSLTYLNLEQSRGMMQVMRQDFERILPDVSAQALTGIPHLFYEWNGVVYLDRSVDVDTTFKVTIDTLPLTFASDESTPPTSFMDNALISFATAYAFRSLESFENSREWMQEYGRALQLAIIADERTPSPEVQAQGFTTLEPRPVTPPWLDPFNPGTDSATFGR